MTEVELKAVLSPEQAVSLPGRLADLGFVPGDIVQEQDLYYNAPHRDFRTTDEALRLRTITGSRNETVLTYKGPKRDSRSNTRLEHETSVGDSRTVQDILLSLGFCPVLTVCKDRRTYHLDAVTVCLDQVEGLGSYLELEHLLPDESGREVAVDGLLSLLDRLGVQRQALERRSYLELLLATTQAGGVSKQEE